MSKSILILLCVIGVLILYLMHFKVEGYQNLSDDQVMKDAIDKIKEAIKVRQAAAPDTKYSGNFYKSQIKPLTDALNYAIYIQQHSLIPKPPPPVHSPKSKLPKHPKPIKPPKKEAHTKHATKHNPHHVPPPKHKKKH